MNNSFLLLYSPKPRSQVRILRYRNWPIPVLCFVRSNDPIDSRELRPAPDFLLLVSGDRLCVISLLCASPPVLKIALICCAKLSSGSPCFKKRKAIRKDCLMITMFL